MEHVENQQADFNQICLDLIGQDDKLILGLGDFAIFIIKVSLSFVYTVKPVLSSHLKNTKNWLSRLIIA